jgi:hypothetical protein
MHAREVIWKPAEHTDRNLQADLHPMVPEQLKPQAFTNSFLFGHLWESRQFVILDWPLDYTLAGHFKVRQASLYCCSHLPYVCSLHMTNVSKGLESRATRTVRGNETFVHTVMLLLLVV